MELLYIWIKEYRGLKNISLNFSNELQFNLDENLTLNISKVENYIPDFFGSNITNLTALIGENGSGKTTVLKFIMDMIANYQYFSSDKQYILCYKVNNELYYYNTESINIALATNSVINIIHSNTFLLSPRLVYLSNTFDPTYINLNDERINAQINNLYNLSTSYLLLESHSDSRNEELLSDNFTFENRITSFAAEEFKKIVKLISWLNIKKNHQNAFPVTHPPFLNFKIYNSYNEKLDNQFDRLKTILYYSNRDNIEIFMLDALFSGIQQIFLNLFKTSKQEYVNQKIDEILSSTISAFEKLNLSYKDDFILILNKLTYQFRNETKKYNNKLESDILSLQTFLMSLYNFLTENKNIINTNDKICSLKLNDENNLQLNQLIESFYESGNVSNFIDLFLSHNFFEDTAISSGEYAMLNIFARLNSLDFKADSQVLLLVDEAELALHPQWQKEFIHHFIDFINERFSNHKVQIIMTAHSPFILSDLPANCVILLKKESDKKVVVENLEYKQETFGANIHELFTDSFFLKNGLMGEFARNKIDKLINEIKDAKSITKEEYENKYKSRINIIGEPFIRSKINELVASKSEISVIDIIIEQRTDEIERLRNLKNRNTND